MKEKIIFKNLSSISRLAYDIAQIRMGDRPIVGILHLDMLDRILSGKEIGQKTIGYFDFYENLN